MSSVKILALCGSLRARSTNRTLLEAAQLLAPHGLSVTRIVDGSIVPHFNADLEASDMEPEEVREWRSLVAGADGLLVSSPEYAAGIPGAFKNALDWLVGSVTFPGKPVMLMFGSSASVHAPASLREILRTMSAVLVPEADVTVELRGKSPTPEDVASDPAFAAEIRRGVDAFVHRIERLRAPA